MKTKIKIAAAVILLLLIILISGCSSGHVTVGVGVYVPGAWVGPYGGGYYPPVGVGYPRY
jgi:hypothetical protein